MSMTHSSWYLMSKETFQQQAQKLLVKRVTRFGGDYTIEEFNADPVRKAQRKRLQMKRENAFRKAIPFDIEYPDIQWPTHCPVLGLELDYSSPAGRRVEHSASFDRIDPSKGYLKGNVRVISWRANRIKNDGTAAEHRKIAAYMEES